MMNFKRVTTVLATTAVLSVGFAVSAYAGTWQQNETGWWYQKDDGSYPANESMKIDGKRYSFDENGYMRTNCWRRLNSTQKWYYYGGDGAALTDTWIDGTYYVGADGAMLVDCLTPDGYRVDSRGRWIEGARRVYETNVKRGPNYSAVYNEVEYHYDKQTGEARIYFIYYGGSFKDGKNASAKWDEQEQAYVFIREETYRSPRGDSSKHENKICFTFLDDGQLYEQSYLDGVLRDEYTYKQTKRLE